jgi:hypothetical protein
MGLACIRIQDEADAPEKQPKTGLKWSHNPQNSECSENVKNHHRDNHKGCRKWYFLDSPMVAGAILTAPVAV